MSVASLDVELTYISDNEQYQTGLMCATTDLIQRYSGTPANPVIPDDYNWAMQKPVLQVLLSSASPGMTEATLKSKMLAVQWYVNGTLINFPQNANSSGQRLSPQTLNFPSGTFNQILHGGNDYPFGAIQILGNIVGATNGASAILKAVISFEDNSGSTVVKEHTFTLGVRQFASDGYTLDIYVKGSNELILTEAKPTTQLSVRLFKGADNIFDTGDATKNTGYIPKWYTYDDTTTNDWAIIQAAGSGDSLEFAFDSTGKELIVGRDGVPTNLLVMCALFKAGTTDFSDYKGAEAIGYERINDKTDSLFIQVTRNPADGVLRAGETTPDGVTILPKLMDKDSQSQVAGAKFKFLCMSPAGTILNGTSAQLGTSIGGSPIDSNNNNTADNTEYFTFDGANPTPYKVPRAMMAAIGDIVRVMIMAYLD